VAAPPWRGAAHLRGALRLPRHLAARPRHPGPEGESLGLDRQDDPIRARRGAAKPPSRAGAGDRSGCGDDAEGCRGARRRADQAHAEIGGPRHASRRDAPRRPHRRGKSRGRLGTTPRSPDDAQWVSLDQFARHGSGTKLRTNYGPRRPNSAHVNDQPWTPATSGSRSTTVENRSGGSRGREFKSRQPDHESPRGHDDRRDHLIVGLNTPAESRSHTKSSAFAGRGNVLHPLLVTPRLSDSAVGRSRHARGRCRLCASRSRQRGHRQRRAAISRAA
jgi:hypothetical protein